MLVPLEEAECSLLASMTQPLWVSPERTDSIQVQPWRLHKGQNRGERGVPVRWV